MPCILGPEKFPTPPRNSHLSSIRLWPEIKGMSHPWGKTVNQKGRISRILRLWKYQNHSKSIDSNWTNGLEMFGIESFHSKFSISEMLNQHRLDLDPWAIWFLNHHHHHHPKRKKNVPLRIRFSRVQTSGLLLYSSTLTAKYLHLVPN